MKNKKKSLTIFFSIALLVCTVQANATGYSFTELGTLGGNWSIATAINNAGQVVGSSTISVNSFTPQAFIWTSGQIKGLGTLGGSNSSAADINDLGQTVGFSYLGGNLGPVPTVWHNHSITSLSPNVQSFSRARGINNSGQIVGELDNSATLWSAGDSTYLGSLGGLSIASDINNSGKIVGNYFVGNSYERGNPIRHATMWYENSITDLGTLGGTNSYAVAINDFGLIVGTSDTNNDTTAHATLWNGSTIKDLGKLTGSKSSNANGINNVGQIVGESFSYDSNTNFATMWYGDSIINLNSLLDSDVVSAGWVLSEANDINDYGQIIGNAFNHKTGQIRAFMLTPVPEPESYAMMFVGLALVGAATNRVNKRA